MNVIFLDFDGVLDTIHDASPETIEKRIITLAHICRKYNCKVVIESTMKDVIDEETLETENEWVKFILDTLKKHGIDCIGRTPTIRKKLNDYTYIPVWKEDEIRAYLLKHPEISHYCIIDDDDLGCRHSGLNKIRNHLVQTLYYSNNTEEEGLLPKHEEEVGEALQKENEIQKLTLKKKKSL